ncbi:MAG TPA: DUF1573 domain-containing protein [Bacteroidales bacterium]|jgi:hypothetical protein|nr:DUF1573 domain-containing protein [Bacteroidales bacterium]MBV6456516.1 hypothetical protein [Bacteroidales bacterium]HNT47771.1 DUF1573 domain-containing protein [Bacteroidales bacterium]HNW22145.1 DUF1573 domain-containing protein [Bacteroidales bacterium]HNZ45904.1 DUF1573 domain-containing protein [Bacteroidales bacterium]
MMRLLVFLFSSLLIQVSAFAQQEGAVTFDKTVHDFGDFGINDGPKTHTFTLTNNSAKAIVIQTVISSCGCTVPEWTKEPLQPAAKGTITVTYSNDQGPYPFDKMMSVYISGFPEPFILRIRGVVHQKKFTLEDTHPVVMGPLRLRNRELELGQIRQGMVKTDSVQVINTGKLPVFLKFESPDKNLQVSAMPSRLNPAESGMIVYSIDTRKQEDWGNVLYTCQVVINDRRDPLHVLTVKGSIKMNTSGMTRADKEMAPIPQMDKSAVEFPLTPAGSEIKTNFSLSNKGKSPLVIHKIDLSHAGIKVTMDRQIAPGATVPVSILIPGTETGTPGEVIYTISLTTNAPSRPTVNLLVYGKIKP